MCYAKRLVVMMNDNSMLKKSGNDMKAKRSSFSQLLLSFRFRGVYGKISLRSVERSSQIR